MKINPVISPQLIKNISSVYTEPTRVFMEYIDNAFDEAEKYFDKSTNKYIKKIKLQMILDGNKHNKAKLIFKDNCGGIKEMSDIVSNIGNSCKKNQPFLNGQFGYGIFSFMAVCDQIEITSNNKGNIQSLTMKSEDFDKTSVNDITFDIQDKGSSEPLEDSTHIILSHFDKSKWKEINPVAIETEIQTHFNYLLDRANVSVVAELSNSRKKSIRSFNYDSVEGGVYQNEIQISKGRKIEIVASIKIFLKYTTGKALNKPPEFISNNRRIIPVKKLDLFDTHHKSDIWGHPNITGYIDTGNHLNPTISRKEFQNDKVAKAIFKKLREEEDKILNFIDGESSKENSNDYTSLENIFNDIITSIISSKLEKKIEIGKDTEISDIENDHKYDVLIESKTGDKVSKVINEKPVRKKSETNDNQNNNNQNNSNTIQFRKSVEFLNPEVNNTNSFSLKIDTISEPIEDSNGKPKRSELFGSQVLIYKKHSDFMKRIDNARRSKEKISSSLIYYITSEFFLHYVSSVPTLQSNASVNSTNDQLINFTDYLYKSEELMKPLVDKSLNDLAAL